MEFQYNRLGGENLIRAFPDSKAPFYILIGGFS